jgi:drug/metabolite transporter (DMT)-like permease
VLGLALALSSSLCWGVSDFIGGVQARRVSLLRVILVSQGVGLCCLVVLIAARGAGPPALMRLLPAAAAGLGGIAALTAFYRALAIGTMSIVAPISATGAAVPVIVGVAGGDRPAALQLAGILAAIVGVVLASRETGSGPRERGAARASVALALVAALGFGSFFVGMRSSARADVLWALFAARAAGVLALLVTAAVRGGVRGSPGGSRGAGRSAAGRAAVPLVAIGILDLSANGLYALATRHGLLSVVAVAASLYPLATVLLARALLGERVRRVQELGIVAALAGVVMIAAG